MIEEIIAELEELARKNARWIIENQHLCGRSPRRNALGEEGDRELIRCEERAKLYLQMADMLKSRLSVSPKAEYGHEKQVEVAKDVKKKGRIGPPESQVENEN